MSGGRIRNVTPKAGYVWDGASVIPAPPNVIPMRDGLANVITGRGTSVDRTTQNFWAAQQVAPEQIAAAYRSSWLHRKIVDIPAQDMTYAGRDWDAPDEDIAKIEAEEKRLQVWQKLHRALILGRLGGGALLIGMKDRRPDLPLPSNVRLGDIEYLTPLSRWQLKIGGLDYDPASPNLLQPEYFEISGQSGSVRIHPSRVIIFPGLPVPSFNIASAEDAFWGDSVITAVNDAVEQAEMASAGFAGLIDEAKVDVFGFAGLVDQLSQPGGEAKVMQRVAMTNTGKSIHRAVVLDKDDTWEQRQITWSGMRDVIITYDARVAGAADIPATRLFGKAPDGQNSTGESDLINYYQSIAAKQQMDLRPRIEALDALLLPSAGVSGSPTWAFSPVRVMDEKEQAEVDKLEAETTVLYVNTGLIPEAAMAKATQNRMIESQRWPGLQEAIDEADADGEGLPDDDPSAIVPINGSKGGDPVSRAGSQPPIGSPRRQRDAAAWMTDATPRPLYVQRKLLNADELVAWAKGQGFISTLPAEDMHVTVLYSRQAVDPMKMGVDWHEDERGQITVRPGGPRVIERLGENAVVLRFASPDLEWRHRDMIEAGGSHDWPEYAPHVTISYEIPEGVDLDALAPFAGKLVFGPEIFEALDLDWKRKVSEE